MEIFNSRFSHISENIFEQLDNKSLSNCREVTKSWKRFIDNKNYSWIQIVDIPTTLKNGNTYLHVAAKYGHTGMLDFILNNEEVKSPKNSYDETPFHIACQYGNVNVAELIIEKSFEFKMDLDSKDGLCWTAFLLACVKNQLNVVELIVQKSTKYNIDLTTRENYGRTAFH